MSEVSDNNLEILADDDPERESLEKRCLELLKVSLELRGNSGIYEQEVPMMARVLSYFPSVVEEHTKVESVESARSAVEKKGGAVKRSILSFRAKVVPDSVNRREFLDIYDRKFSIVNAVIAILSFLKGQREEKYFPHNAYEVAIREIFAISDNSEHVLSDKSGPLIVMLEKAVEVMGGVSKEELDLLRKYMETLSGREAIWQEGSELMRRRDELRQELERTEAQIEDNKRREFDISDSAEAELIDGVKALRGDQS